MNKPPPGPSSVQEIMRPMIHYVAAVVKFVEAGRPLDSRQERECADTFKPLEAALTALVDERDRLKFELDGVNAMRGPLTDEQSFKFQHRVLQWNRAQAEPPIRIAYEYNTAAEIAKLYESTEQGESHE